MTFEKQLSKYREIAENTVGNALYNKDGKIYDAMRYSLLAGGKRVRPVLCLACADALSGNIDYAAFSGCAVEIIHTYSLIHDDLPCMDDDALRRGKPTNHIVFGEATAVLSGDALLNYACEYLLSKNIKPDTKLSLLRLLYSASGADGMIYGQMLDMEAEVTPTDEKGLYLLHQKKTGALINAAAAMGAVCANADEGIFYEYSSALGEAFQICDDILDVESNAQVMGKSTGSDEKNHKTTFVTLYGIDGAKARLKEETERAVDSLAFLGSAGGFLKDYAFYLLNRKN